MTLRKSVCLFNWVLMAVGVASCSKSSNTCANPANYKVTIDPAKFATSTSITNHYLPLTPRTVKRFTETDGTLIEITVMPDTKTIAGVQCVVVHDAVTSSTGELLEDTYDWFAQDTDGNVWYFGEDTKAYSAGSVASTKGSWEAGVNCAQPGISMKANPQVGDRYRQEYLAGEAEDESEVVALGETVTVPYSTFSNCVKTLDFTALEPGKDENKWFCPGVGEVKAVDLAVGGGSEELLTMSTVH